MAENKELNKGIDWTKWMSVVIALGALLYAHLAYQNSRSALEFQRQEASKRREDIVKLQAAWDFQKVYFSGFEKTYLARYDDFEEKFLGLHFFAWVKIFNGSEHSISLDGVRGYLIYKDYLHSQLASSMCFEKDFETRVHFPLSIMPQDQGRVLIRIPIPVNQEVAEIYGQLEPDSMYTAEQIVQAWNRKAETRYGSQPEDYPRTLDILFQNQLVPRDSLGTLDSHALKVTVHLASGEMISKRFHIVYMKYDTGT